MATWEIEIEATVKGYICVEADSEDEAYEEAEEQGAELTDLTEILDVAVQRAELFR